MVRALLINAAVFCKEKQTLAEVFAGRSKPIPYLFTEEAKLFHGAEP